MLIVVFCFELITYERLDSLPAPLFATLALVYLLSLSLTRNGCRETIPQLVIQGALTPIAVQAV